MFLMITCYIFHASQVCELKFYNSDDPDYIFLCFYIYSNECILLKHCFKSWWIYYFEIINHTLLKKLESNVFNQI